MDGHETFISLTQLIALLGVIVASASVCITIVMVTSKNISNNFKEMVKRIETVELNYIHDSDCTLRMSNLNKNMVYMHENIRKDFDEHVESNHEILLNLSTDLKQLRDEHLKRFSMHQAC